MVTGERWLPTYLQFIFSQWMLTVQIEQESLKLKVNFTRERIWLVWLVQATMFRCRITYKYSCQGTISQDLRKKGFILNREDSPTMWTVIMLFRYSEWIQPQHLTLIITSNIIFIDTTVPGDLSSLEQGTFWVERTFSEIEIKYADRRGIHFS